ncbi:MAG: HPr kinase/phosphorylase [Rhodoblastus sp.]
MRPAGSDAAPDAARGSLHGVGVVIGEAGVLLRGKSGAGKSRLAEELVEEARRRGWFGRLVADDRVLIAVCGGRLALSPHPAIAGRIERRGQGVFPVAYEKAAVLRLVVDLVERDRAADRPARMPGPDEQTATIAGVSVPRLALAAGEPGAAQAILERIRQMNV